MCDSLQICLVGTHCINILTPYGVKTAFAGKSGKYCVKFLRNWVLQNHDPRSGSLPLGSVDEKRWPLEMKNMIQLLLTHKGNSRNKHLQTDQPL